MPCVPLIPAAQPARFTLKLRPCPCYLNLLPLHTADFGFGPRRAESEALVASLEPSYAYQQLRLQGDYVRVLRAHPGRWQVRLAGRGSDRGH